MRLLLVQIDAVLPAAHGGATANRLMLEAFASRGHECRVVMPVRCQAGCRPDASFVQRLEDLRLFCGEVKLSKAGTVKCVHRAIAYRGVALESGRLAAFLAVAVREFEPDAIFISDAGGPSAGALLAILDAAAPGRLIYCPKTVHCLPFGPFSIQPDALAEACVGRAAAIIAPSRFVGRYIEQHLDRPVLAHYFPVYNPPDTDGETGGEIVLINPCAWKGLPVFLELARRRPNLEFTAVCSWGVSPADRKALSTCANVKLLPHAENIGEIYRRTRVLLAPSLCQEVFGQVVIEAMQRGIPVLAADIGGLPEAKLGVEWTLPVAPIEFTRRARAVEQRVPPQKIEPWIEALDRVTLDAACHARLAAESRCRAAEFVKALDWEPLLAYTLAAR